MEVVVDVMHLQAQEDLVVVVENFLMFIWVQQVQQDKVLLEEMVFSVGTIVVVLEEEQEQKEPIQQVLQLVQVVLDVFLQFLEHLHIMLEEVEHQVMVFLDLLVV